MHRALVAAALVASLAGSPAAQVDLEAEKTRILEEFEQILDRKMEALRQEMRAELDAILQRSGERIMGLAPTERAAPPASQPATPVRPATPANARPYLGIQTRPLKAGLRTMLGVEDGVGLVVDQVRKGSPADLGGLREHDVLLEVNKVKVTGEPEIRKLVGGMEPGDQLTIVALRRGEEITLEVTLGTRGQVSRTPAETPEEKLLRDLTEGRQPPAVPRDLMEQLPPGYREQLEQMLSSPEGKELIEQQFQQLDQMLETPQGREMVLLQLEQLMEAYGSDDEQYEGVMGLLEQFLALEGGERQRVFRGFMEAIQEGRNPFADGIEGLLQEKAAERESAGPREEEDLDRFLDELLEESRPAPGFLGVSLGILDDQVRKTRGLEGGGGALLQGVHAGGPAEHAGVKAGDIVLAVGDEPVQGREDLVTRITSLPAGERVLLTLLGEDGTRRTVTVILGTRPAR